MSHTCSRRDIANIREWIPSGEKGRNAQKHLEESAAEGRRKKSSPPILHARCAPAGNVDSHIVVCNWCAFTHVISRTDTFKDKKLNESCCIVLQLKVSQEKKLKAVKVWPRVFPSSERKMQDGDCGFA